MTETNSKLLSFVAIFTLTEQGGEDWRCPRCDVEDLGSSHYDEEEEARLTTEGYEHLDSQDKHSHASHELASASDHNDEGDSGSALNDPDSDEDDVVNATKQSSRSLRKRTSQSTELDENGVSLRKRRRNASLDGISHDDATDRGNSTDPVGSRSSRAMRLKVAKPPPVLVEKRSRTSLLLKMQVRPGNLKEILSRKKRDRRPAATSTPRPPKPPAAALQLTVAPVPAIETPFTMDSFSQPFYSFFDKETDDAKGKPYGGILSEAEADTSKTLPMSEDRRKFDSAKQKAEDEWRARILAMQAEADLPLRKSKKGGDHASQIECIEFGGWEIDTWYAAPYPAEYSRNRVLYICEFCLKYMNSDYVAWRHKLKCATKHPPGDEIYRHGSVSVFEVDGRKNPVYCQNLCLLAKLFLGSKTLYYDVEPFLFYVLCEYNECGYHFVGYFSKEKRSSSQNNVSCILTLPIHQRKGYGNLLIDFSYLLTKVEQKTGSPEKPLSDMGLVSYRNYWRLVLCRYFIDTLKSEGHKESGLSVKKISDDTGMTADDVISALEGLRALVRDPQTKLYAFRVDLEYCEQYVAKWESKGYVQLKPEALAWTPFVMGRGTAANYEFGPINTIAPREDDEAKVEEGAKTLAAETLAGINGIETLLPNRGPQTPSNMVDADDEMDLLDEKMAEDDKENGPPQNGDATDAPSTGSQDDWRAPYRDIPPSRFEVFPPLNGGRRTDRVRSSISRPIVPRAISSAPRPNRNRTSSAKRPSASRPKSSGSRRKTGGTGRGPGRWPKGTKKSDYGNADSGPGLPPGWLERQAILKQAGGTGKEDLPARGSLHEVQLLAPKAEVNGDGGQTIVKDDVDASGEEV
jgi:histone acetyltransferase SAS3